MSITDARRRTESFYIAHAGKRGHLRTSHSPDGTRMFYDDATMQEFSAIFSDHCNDSADYEKLGIMTGRAGDMLKSDCPYRWGKLKSWCEKVKF